MELELMKRAAREAGKILMEKYGKVEYRFKEDRSLVTDADLASEKRIKEILMEKYPDYAVLGEESGYTPGDGEHTWIIDPLDGTTNYTIKNPFFNVSIALAKGNQPVAGVVYYPFQDEIFHAKKGVGCYLNDQKVCVSDKKGLEGSVLTFCHAHDPQAIERMAGIWRTWKLTTPRVRQIGAAALEMAYVACGRTESFMMLGMNPWDVAAGCVLVREAGGKVTDLSGKEFTTDSKDILASNGLLHEELLESIDSASCPSPA